MRKGLRVIAPLLPAAFAIGASFGVLARASHFSAVAAVAMSATTFAGSSQVAAASILGAGGGIAAAVLAALLLNLRYTPMGVTVAQSFHGLPVWRRLSGHHSEICSVNNEKALSCPQRRSTVW